MQPVRTLGYVTLGVAELQPAIDFYREVVRLTLVERTDHYAHLTGNADHHWLRLEVSESPGWCRPAFLVSDEAHLAEISAELHRRGIIVEQLDEASEHSVERLVRFCDPSGVEVDLYTGMARSELSFGSGIAHLQLLHGVWTVPDVVAQVAFYEQVLGFRVSDWIGEAVAFLRCGDRYHHSMAFGRAEGPTALDHLCFEVATLDDVMRFHRHAVRSGIAVDRPLLRHVPSGSMSVYVFDPVLGHKVELCFGHAQVDDPHEPRRLPPGPATADMWNTPLPELPTLEVDGEVTRGAHA